MESEERAAEEGEPGSTESKVHRRLNVEEFFDRVIADVSGLPLGLGDRLREIVAGGQTSGVHSSIRKAIEDATRGD